MSKPQDRIAEDIGADGFHVLKVFDPEGTEPSFAYTLGLEETFEHPEIAIFGLNDDLDFMFHVLSGLGARVKKGERFEHGAKKTGILPGYSCAFARMPKASFESHFGQALQRRGGARGFKALQCIWPDPKKHFPWEPKVMPPVLARQPVFLRPDAGPRDPVWPFAESHARLVFTTTQVVTGKEPVRFAGRFRDGSFQFVCETTNDENDLAQVSLGWLLDRDPSLKAAAKLKKGDGIVRTEAGTAWKKARSPE